MSTYFPVKCASSFFPQKSGILVEASLNFPVKILISWSNLLTDSFEKKQPQKTKTL